ncbi:MAG: rhomboid family intramembrane serine protease [Saprospiraceae bacterium]|nr:rhomboid family intramembrane serine protease [Saprospiraceae bacterium]
MGEKENDIFQRLILPIATVVLMWLVKIVEVGRGIKYTRWGIYPREWEGAIGIFTAPFIHSDWQHLMSNSLPMFMLLSLVMVFYKRVAIPAITIITLFTGFVVWLFARESYHIGASGVVYGLVGFLAWTGIFRRNLKSIILALVILVMFGGYFHGIVPTKEGVSWESHLFGALVGIFTAFLFKNVREEDEFSRPDPWADERGKTEYFLPRDAFDLTKEERYHRSLQPPEDE